MLIVGVTSINTNNKRLLLPSIQLFGRKDVILHVHIYVWYVKESCIEVPTSYDPHYNYNLLKLCTMTLLCALFCTLNNRNAFLYQSFINNKFKNCSFWDTVLPIKWPLQKELSCCLRKLLCPLVLLKNLINYTFQPACPLFKRILWERKHMLLTTVMTPSKSGPWSSLVQHLHDLTSGQSLMLQPLESAMQPNFFHWQVTFRPFYRNTFAGD